MRTEELPLEDMELVGVREETGLMEEDVQGGWGWMLTHTRKPKQRN